MKCFYHNECEAVGTCKSCGRGVCRECAVEFEKGLACAGRCEADVEAQIQFIQRNMEMSAIGFQHLASSQRTLQQLPFIQLAIGALLALVGSPLAGTIGLDLPGPLRKMFLILGGIFALWGVVGIYNRLASRRGE